MSSRSVKFILCLSWLALAGCADRNNFETMSSSSIDQTQIASETDDSSRDLDFNDPEVLKIMQTLSSASQPLNQDAESSATSPIFNSPPISTTSSSSAAPVDTADKPEDTKEEEMIPEPPQKISKQVVEKGMIIPTVYYFPIVDEDETECSKKIDMRDSKGNKLIKICKKTQALCALQGSCAVVQNGETRSFNIAGRNETHNIFFEMTEDDCKFGYGVKSSCLDPFYTLAADLKIYRPGDVIFIPAIRGMKLPDGTDHSGYFIVRDKGRAIIGKGRFDFFSGYYHWRSDENPFTKMGLTSKKTKIPYYRIQGNLAKAFTSARAFPKLPHSAIDERPE